MKYRKRIWGTAILAILLSSLANGRSAPDPAVIFATRFEESEGYDIGFTLVGQNSWVGFGSGGNGLVTNFFDGEGQQAFVGVDAPSATDTLSVFRPINFVPLTNNQPIIKFSVLMSIEASSSTNRDDFRWSVYNSAGKRLFSLDFDGVEHLVSYALDNDAGFVSTGTIFTNSTLYDLVITMNFARNLWSAALNNLRVANNQPITTRNLSLDLGDVDAVWVIRTPGAPGSNYMLFDNYQITAEPVSSIEPTVEPLSRLADGQFLLRVFGESGLNYLIEASSDLLNWTPIKTVNVADGTADFLDSAAPNFQYRFYRAQQTVVP